MDIESGSLFAIVIPNPDVETNFNFQYWVDGQKGFPPEAAATIAFSVGGTIIFCSCIGLFAVICSEGKQANKYKDKKPQISRKPIELENVDIFTQEDLAKAPVRKEVNAPSQRQLVNESSESSMTSITPLGATYKSAVVNKEEMTLQEFKKAMWK